MQRNLSLTGPPVFFHTLVLLLSLPALALAQDLYRCLTPAGRLVMSDTPCPAGSAETVMERQERTSPAPGKTPRASRASGPASAAAKESTLAVEPDVPAQECVHVNDVATAVSKRRRFHYDLRWKVDLSNRCRRPLPIALTFGLYDRNDFEIRAARRNVRLPQRDSLTVRGTLSLSHSELQRISARKADVQLR